MRKDGGKEWSEENEKRKNSLSSFSILQKGGNGNRSSVPEGGKNRRPV
jgi:hypothetical protein